MLDSVVPARSLDGLEVDGMHETARVLRDVCRAQHCPGDPAADLAAVVRARTTAPELDDTFVAMSVGAPDFPGVPRALREARQGHPQRLDRLVRAVRRAQRAPAQVLSQGLHAATACADLRTPWGGPAAPLAGRQAALRRAAAGADPGPYDRATVIGNGLLQTCLRWPPTPGPPVAALRRPAAGADAAARRRPRPLHAAAVGARAGGAHAERTGSSSSRARAIPCSRAAPGGEGRRAVQRFLLG